jgi:hypothetical protein
MAGRPVIKRTSKTYHRDIETLNRLRMSVQLNESGNVGQDTVALCDGLIRNLILLKNEASRENKAA